jgi:ribonuclease P protein component
MLDRANRITKASEFRTVLTSGSRAMGEKLAVYCYQATRDQMSSTRIGLVVGKACGSAVVRNQIKRRLRSLVRAALPSLPAGCLFVVRALPASAQADYQTLQNELSSALDQAWKKHERKLNRLQQS